METTLEEALPALGLADRVPALEGARQRSEQVVTDMAKSLVERLGDALPLDVVLCGSVARRDFTAASEVDYLVVTHGSLHEPHDLMEVLSVIEEIRHQLGLHEPGRPASTGRVVAAADLVDRIGLEDDTETSRANRSRILVESVSVYRPKLRDELIAAIVGRACADYDRGKRGVPRPLLNDVLWYWRTLSVVHQAKRWGGAATSWGPRYLDLIVARKIAVAGTLATVFRCEEVSPDYFVRELNRPPLARLLRLHEAVGERHLSDLRRIVEVLEDYLAAVSDEGFRGEAAQVRSRRDIDTHPHYRRMIIRARELQAALESLFFDSTALAERSRKYLGF